MRTRLRIFLLSLFAVVSFVLAPSPDATNGHPLADPQCPAGTNWDDKTQTCH